MTMLKTKFRRALLPVAVALPVMLLGGCLGSSDDANDEVAAMPTFDISSVDYASISVDESNLQNGARQLAAQCAQCHGTYGAAVRDWPELWGNHRGITRSMVDYQDHAFEYNVMHLHAMAYTEEEVDLLKSYYPKVTYSVEGE